MRAKEEAEAEKLIADAKALEEAGCCSIVLEKIPADLAEKVTAAVSCPTIGIGAGNKCDGQVLVYADMLGMNKGFKPKFLRQYADLHSIITDAVGRYVADVKRRTSLTRTSHTKTWTLNTHPLTTDCGTASSHSSQ